MLLLVHHRGLVELRLVLAAHRPISRLLRGGSAVVRTGGGLQNFHVVPGGENDDDGEGHQRSDQAGTIGRAEARSRRMSGHEQASFGSEQQHQAARRKRPARIPPGRRLPSALRSRARRLRPEPRSSASWTRCCRRPAPARSQRHRESAAAAWWKMPTIVAVSVRASSGAAASAASWLPAEASDVPPSATSPAASKGVIAGGRKRGGAIAVNGLRTHTRRPSCSTLISETGYSPIRRTICSTNSRFMEPYIFNLKQKYSINFSTCDSKMTPSADDEHPGDDAVCSVVQGRDACRVRAEREPLGGRVQADQQMVDEPPEARQTARTAGPGRRSMSATVSALCFCR